MSQTDKRDQRQSRQKSQRRDLAGKKGARRMGQEIKLERGLGWATQPKTLHPVGSQETVEGLSGGVAQAASWFAKGALWWGPYQLEGERRAEAGQGEDY